MNDEIIIDTGAEQRRISKDTAVELFIELKRNGNRAFFDTELILQLLDHSKMQKFLSEECEVIIKGNELTINLK